MMVTRFAIIASFVVATFCGAVAVAQTSYTITDLGNLGFSSYPAAINSNGQIVGTSYLDSAQTNSCAFFYDASSTGAKTMVNVFGAGSYSTANGINDSGQFVGSVLDSYTSAGTTNYQYDGYTANLGTQSFTALSFSSTGQIIVGGQYTESASSANAINATGVIAGTTILPGDSSYTQYGFTYNPTAGTSSLFPNPTNAAGSGLVVSNNGINASGVYVGTYGLSSASTAVHLAYYYDPTNGTINQIHTPVDTSSGSYYAEANGVNASGQVVGGGVMSTAGNGTFHAYRFDIYGAGTMVDLGALGTGDYSEAYGINTSAQIVGFSNLSAGGTSFHAFVYNSSGGMTDLNSLIPANSGWDLEDATAINDSGWIVGFGVNSAGATDGFLLEPGAAVVHNPGDVNGDGRVDINDLTIVLTNYGKTGMAWSQGDIDGDPTGHVDVNDLTIVLTDYNKTYNSPLTAVPEPASLLMLAIAILLPAAGWGIARRRTPRS
jgi:probable HAF family extracellular repeat protein